MYSKYLEKTNLHIVPFVHDTFVHLLGAGTVSFLCELMLNIMAFNIAKFDLLKLY